MKQRQKTKLKKLEQQLTENKTFQFPRKPNRILHKKPRLQTNRIPTKTNPAIPKNQFIAARWCRQSGKSQTISALLLHYALTHPNTHGHSRTKLETNKTHSLHNRRLRKRKNHTPKSPRKRHKKDKNLTCTNIQEIKPKPNKPIIETVGKTLKEALEILSKVGLNDAFLFLHTYKQLSDGQKYRYKIAKLIEKTHNSGY